MGQLSLDEGGSRHGIYKSVCFSKSWSFIEEKILVGERKLEAAVTGFFGKKLQQKQVIGLFGSGVGV